MRKSFFAIFVAFIVASASAAEESSATENKPYGVEIDMQAALGYSNATGMLYDRAFGGFSFVGDAISFEASFVVTNDGKYSPSEFWMASIGNQYFLLNSGSTSLHFGSLSFKGGYLAQLSPFSTPYELFLNSSGHSSLGAVITYDIGLFYYESRWISINSRSSQVYGYTINGPTYTDVLWRDKGMNYRVIGFHSGPYYFGYEESAIYVDRSFDPVYFLCPLPCILVNSITASGSNPWTQMANDNSIMGLFFQYSDGPIFAFAQILLDDINLNFIFGDSSSLSAKNLNKLAWSLAFKYKFDFGTIGFFHAGATMYTYAATYSEPTNFNSVPYEYTWYPVPASNGKIIDVTENNIGFKYGENALAFMLVYDTVLFADTPYGFSLDAGLEWAINGSKSPHKPWHEYASWVDIPYRTGLFSDDPVLEQRIIFSLALYKDFAPFSLSFKMDIGGIFNKLQVVYGNASLEAANAPKMYKPQAGLNEFVFAFSVGFSYRVGF